MAYTSYGTRKALGRRYSTDPALIAEMERLNQQYALAPGREARALQASQFQQTFAENQRQFNETQQSREEAQEQAAQAGMVGTAGNVALTGGLIRAMTMKPGEPFWGNWGSTPVGGAVSPAAIDAGATGFAAGTGGPGLQAAYTPPSMAAPAGAGSAVAGYGAQGGLGTPIGAMESGFGAAMGPAAAGYGAGYLSSGVKEIGRVATLGMVKDRTTRNVAGGVAAGAAAGAAIGGIPTGGIGAPVGAVIGGIIGGIGGLVGGGK